MNMTMRRGLAPLHLGLVKKDQCFFRRITPAFAKRNPQYRPFIGFFLVMETTDHLDEGSVVSELMIYREQQYLHMAA